jgi:PAS domain S-box-containing protein
MDTAPLGDPEGVPLGADGSRATTSGSGPEAEALRRVDRLFATYVRCHQALIRARREKDLLYAVCRTLVQNGGYCLAWVGYAEQDGETALRTVAWAGKERHLDRDDVPFASALSLPLVAEGSVLGELWIHGDEPDAFDTRALELLKGLADDLAHAIVSCRMRAAHKYMSEALRETRGKYALARFAGQVGVWDWDLDTNEMSLDPILKSMLGYEDHEIRNHLHDWSKCIHPEDMDRVLAAAAVHLGGVAPQYEIEHRMLHRDGSVRWFLARGTAVPNAHGLPCRLLGANMDITERKRLEEQLSLSQKMEVVGRLAGGIAHDFNNWMTIIGLSAKLVERQIPCVDAHLEDRQWEDEMRHYVGRISSATERAGELTKRLLSLSRHEFVQPRLMDVNGAIEDLARLLRRLIDEDITLRTLPSDGLWTVYMDPTQVDQLVMNLVLNARDAMPGGGTLTIETANAALAQEDLPPDTGVEPGEYVMLAVADTGIGMDAGVQSRIFEPFFTTKEPGEGTGLGLATVFGVVEQNKGHIHFETEVGQGTTFRVYLPRAEPANGGAPSPAAQASRARGTETILVAEDAVAVREMLVRTLRTHGYQVLVATDGLEALQISRMHEGPIHLLLTDLVMPQMSGTELVEQLQPRRPETQVLYMSGYADRPLVRQLVSDEASVFLPKPFSAEALTEKVRDVLDAWG